MLHRWFGSHMMRAQRAAMNIIQRTVPISPDYILCNILYMVNRQPCMQLDCFPSKLTVGLYDRIRSVKKIFMQVKMRRNIEGCKFLEENEVIGHLWWSQTPSRNQWEDSELCRALKKFVVKLKRLSLLGLYVYRLYTSHFSRQHTTLDIDIILQIRAYRLNWKLFRPMHI